MMRRFRNVETGVVFKADEDTQPPVRFFTEQAAGSFEEVHEEAPKKVTKAKPREARAKKSKSDNVKE